MKLLKMLLASFRRPHKISLPQEKAIDETLVNRNVISMYKGKRRNRYDVSFKTVAKAGGRILPIRVLDVSREGLRVSCQEKIAHQLEIDVTDQFGQSHQLIAQKIWQNDCGVFGLRILKAGNSWHDMIDFFEEDACLAVFGSDKKAVSN